ncbi:MAG: DUF1080 domain-containing protein [Planctomycetales bacterium]|nr:DUF1080 domain-containing protein [Planctomycetales bacterium]
MQRLARLGFSLFLFLATLPVAAENALTEHEKQAGFELLFNGQDLSGWEQKGNWVVVGGAIARKEKGGDITYKVKKVPDDFELRFEWKVAEGSNSGVYYRPGQYEYQILDNARHYNGKNPRQCAASLYFCMAPARDATREVGQWNTGQIVCQGTLIQHWLNGERVVDFDYADPKWSEEVELLRVRGADLAARGAYLRLQDHGDPVWYRNLRLRAIPADEKVSHVDVTPMPIPPEARKAELAKVQAMRQKRKSN